MPVSIGPSVAPPKVSDIFRCTKNLVRENVENNFVQIEHIGGKMNLADLFTKEMKDTNHFVTLRNLMMRLRPSI